MKKLMIAAAIVCAAAFAQAGVAKWGALDIKSSGAAYTADTTYSAYFFIGNDVTAVTKYLSDAETLDLNAFTAAAGDTATATYNTSASKMNFPTKTSSLEFKSESVTAFMIIVDAADIKDAKNFLVAEKSGSPYVTQSFGATGDKSFSWGAQTSNTNWQAVAAPEPTSGLLLLLGVAGLALRRRRA